MYSLLPPLLSAASAVMGLDPAGPSSLQCRCVPGEACWPSEDAWHALGDELGGNVHVIKSAPLAESCYQGPNHDAGRCAFVNKMWTDVDFQTSQPLGRWYPRDLACPPVDADAAAACTLGPLPAYAVKATRPEHIGTALRFAQRHKLRVAVVNTGHDLNGRADGFGSLAIWLRHFRNAIVFHDAFVSATLCRRSGWLGSAIHIDGAWQWSDVYRVAKAHNVIVVGGGSASPGATGGWLSGGGHGPATRNYGLGADQLLEADVMLANGSVVTANHCQHAHLFRALRGGGPGYGIVLGTKVKAHPNVDIVTSHGFSIVPRDAKANNKKLLDAVAVLFQSYPDLVEAGYAGYAVWFPQWYNHSLFTIGEASDTAREAYSSTTKNLTQLFGSQLSITATSREYKDFWSFYESEMGKHGTPGDGLLVTSRLVDRESVRNYANVRKAVEAVSGDANGSDMNIVALVSGGQVFQDADDKSSGVHPAWRTSPMMLLSTQPVPRTATAADRKSMTNRLTKVKGAAAKKLARHTGGYMNEGDGNDADWKSTFYGSNYDSHLQAKDKYDPERVFYCPTCVGSDRFIHKPDGRLCSASMSSSS